MELDQLRYFLRVAARGSFTRAAEDLLVSQPALSRSIQKLEEELGQPVFERRTRSVSLTDAGTLLQARVLAGAGDPRRHESRDHRRRQERPHPGRRDPHDCSRISCPEILSRFSAAFPKATLVVQENTTDPLLKSCTQGEIDLAIVALPIPAKYLEVEELFEEELFLVLPPDHSLDRINPRFD